MRNDVTKKLFQLACGLVFGGAVLVTPSVSAQEQQPGSNGSEVAGNIAPVTKAKAPTAVTPLFTNYKGIAIGMSADEVRQKLGHLKEHGNKLDIFFFSDRESAQVYYDDKGMVQAVSIDYKGNESGAPDAVSVLGEELTANANGGLYKLVRYPDAKYWVSYSRTLGDSPMVTVTMQKMN